jgi:hypothetical protein
MTRRAARLCRWEKIWPEMKVFVTSPRIDFDEHFKNGIRENLIHELVGIARRA